MDINKIKFVPKANAFAEVYGKATGVPFIGELVAAAAGNGGEPTPPTPSVVESVTFYAVQNTPSECMDFGYEGSCYGTYITLTLNQSWLNENINDIGQINVLINDDNDQNIDTGIFYLDSSTNVFYSESVIDGTLQEMPESGPYNITVYSNDLTPLYEGTGTWTYEEPPVVESVTVTARQNSTSECQMYGMESCYELGTVMTLNQNWITSNCSEGLYYNLTIKDSSDNTIVETSNGILNCAESNVVEGSDYPEGSMPTFPESGNYVLSIYNIETPDIHIFDGTGTWTYQDPQI